MTNPAPHAFSDAAISVAAGAEMKWIYNSARRLGRRVERSADAVIWWRLTHHLAGQLGMPLSDAAKAATYLVGSGPRTGRVRLRATTDESVAVTVDIDRFFDGAAIAASSALHFATPRRRGRPARRAPSYVQPLTSPVGEVGHVASEARFLNTLAAISAVQNGVQTADVLKLLSALSEGGVAYVIAGAVAARFHGIMATVASLNLIVDLEGESSWALARTLNAVGAIPRSVRVRDGFQFHAALLRDIPGLALQVGELPLDIVRHPPAGGSFSVVRDASMLVSVGGLSLRLLSRDYLAISPDAVTANRIHTR